MSSSVLLAQQSKSVLGSQSAISRQAAGGRKKRGLGFALNLTTLIDAFCILVIFLLSNMNGESQNIDISKKIALPMAKQSDLLSLGTVIKLEGNEMFVDDVPVNPADLVARLLEVRKSKEAAPDQKERESLIIQADKGSDFDAIGDLLRAGGQAGYTNYMFAVWPGSK